MSKKKIKEKNGELGFSLRGLENTRIESLSDGVFAIAIGLLLLSTSPPTTYDELKTFTRDFIPFGFTIAMLIYIWHQHYLFFIRYGLRDAKTVALNTLLLFLVLFYVYPLKFLFSVLVQLYRGLIFNDREGLEKLFTEVIPIEDTSELMALYGFGAASVFAVLAFLNFRALRKKEELDLSTVEVVHTQNTIRFIVVAGLIPLASAIVAFTGLGGKTNFALSGMMYMSYAIAMPIAGKISAKMLKRLNIPNKE